MRISTKPLVFLALLLIAAPSIANSPIPDEDFKEWLDCIRTKVTSSDNAGLIKQFAGKRIFSCAFYVSKDGTPEKLRVCRSSGEPSLDNSAMDLIRKSTSLPICPFNQKRVVILCLKNCEIQLSQGGYR